MPRLPIAIRQNRVFELVVEGKTYEQICSILGISDDTVARDLKAVGDQVQEFAKTRLGEVVGVALANLQAVLDEAWKNYRESARRLKDWEEGRLDKTFTDTSIKTLAEQRRGADGLELGQESEPVEVKRTTRTVRPAIRDDRADWLRIVVDTTAQICKLFGIEKQLIEVSGPGGAAIPVSIEQTLERIYGPGDGQ